jgi:hypothetical protein
MVEDIKKLISIVNDNFEENQIFVCFTIWFMYFLYFYEFSQLHCAQGNDFLGGQVLIFIFILKKKLKKIISV